MGGVRIVHGGFAIVLPFVQKTQIIDLRMFLIKKEKDRVKTDSGLTALIDWVAEANFEADETSLATAARLFLGKERHDVVKMIEEALSANVRAISGQLTIEQLHADRDKFIRLVQELASDELAQMGVTVILGIQEITDELGYFEAMAAPKVAVTKRIAAEAEALAREKSEQAELDADRKILEQREALELRKVQKERGVGIAQAEADLEVQQRRAKAEEHKQEAEILVPARAAREATELEAQGKALAVKAEADAEAEATEKVGKAEAAATKAKLLAQAEGEFKLAEAKAAEGQVNLVQTLFEVLANADVEKAKAYAEAIAGIGEKVSIVDFGSGGSEGSALKRLLLEVPQIATMLNAQIKALTGEDLESNLDKIRGFIKGIESEDTPAKLEARAEKVKTKTAKKSKTQTKKTSRKLSSRKPKSE
jgi:flotillin